MILTIVKEIKSSQMIMLPGGFSAGDEPDGSAKFIATVFRNERVAEAVNEFLTKQDGLMLGICNGFQALIKLGLVPYGEIRKPSVDAPTLTYNNIGRHQAKIVQTRIASNKSPWLANTSVGDIHSIAISHGEGKFVANEETMRHLIENGQIATQYVDFNGNATYDIDFNPNGSSAARTAHARSTAGSRAAPSPSASSRASRGASPPSSRPARRSGGQSAVYDL